MLWLALMNWFSGPMMILAKFPEINAENPSDENPAVFMKGRAGGLINFLLSLVDLAPQITIRITPGEARLSFWSFYGSWVHIVSLQAKPSATVSTSRPFHFLILGAMFLVFALISLVMKGWLVALFLLVLVGLCALLFYVGQQFSVGIVGFSSLRFRVRPGLLTGEPITFEKMLDVIDIIRRLIDRVGTPTRLETPSRIVDVAPVGTTDPEELAGRAFQALLEQAKQPRGKPADFLRDLEEFVQRHPGTRWGQWAGAERQAVQQFIQAMQYRQGNQTLYRQMLRTIQTQFDKTLAASWAAAYLQKDQ